MTIHTRLILCCLVAASACSSHGNTSTSRRDRNLITAQQIEAGHFENAYDAVQALRPNWLTPRGTDSFAKPSEIEVYYDSNHLGRIDALRTILRANIVYIRWYNGTEAQQRFGLGHSAGVIHVSSHTD